LKDTIVGLARKAHSEHWRMSGDEGTGDRLASKVTESWQRAVTAIDPRRFHVEYQIAPHLRERIDIVDLEDGTAYELKVSPNNAHFEFYRDIFKVIVARDTQLPTLRRFVFIAPTLAADKLMRNLGGAVVADSLSLGLSLEVAGI